MMSYPACSLLPVIAIAGIPDRHETEFAIAITGLGDRHPPESLIVFTGLRIFILHLGHESARGSREYYP
jgi:hypothetical protein